MKVLRISRVSKLIANSNQQVEDKAKFQVVYYTVLLVIYTHVLACAMWQIL